MAMTKRVYPLCSLNPYLFQWTIKVQLTRKGNIRTYNNARGEGCVLNVELTDEQGTQIQASMFNETAKKLYDQFQTGKVYYISKGVIKLANKVFNTVQNDYEMTLNEKSQVEEVSNEVMVPPKTKFNFVPISELEPYVTQNVLIDVIGILQHASPIISIKRKLNHLTIPKRDITIADDKKKTAVVSLWSEHATNLGQLLFDMVDQSPIVAIKSLRVGDFKGVSLSTLGQSILEINPDIPESHKLRSWYNSEGKETTYDSIAHGLRHSKYSEGRSFYSDRVTLYNITSDSSLGEKKPVYFSIRASLSFIKSDQTMSYRGCKTCNKKVTKAIGSAYWCEICMKNVENCDLRYVLSAKLCDASGEAWCTIFNDEAEKLLGCSANELDAMKSEDDGFDLHLQLKKAMWVTHLLRVSVARKEYNNEKRQRITIVGIAPIDFAAESRFLLEDMNLMKKQKSIK